MALISINIGRRAFRRLVAVLERISDALDRAYPIPVHSKGKPLEAEDMIQVTDETLWEQEQAEELKRQQGLPVD